MYYASPIAGYERYLKHEMIIPMAGGAAQIKFTEPLASKLVKQRTMKYNECRSLYYDILKHYHFDKGTRLLTALNERPASWPGTKEESCIIEDLKI